MNTTSAPNSRFEYIDALRGFAIIGVILAHSHSVSIMQIQGLKIK